MPLRRSSILVAVFGMPKEGHLCLTRYKGSNCSTATVHLVNTKVTQLISNLSPTNTTGNTGGDTPMNNRDIHCDIAELLTPKTSLPVDHPTSTRLAVTVVLLLPSKYHFAPLANWQGSAWPVPRVRFPPRMKFCLGSLSPLVVNLRWILSLPLPVPVMLPPPNSMPY